MDISIPNGIKSYEGGSEKEVVGAHIPVIVEAHCRKEGQKAVVDLRNSKHNRFVKVELDKPANPIVICSSLNKYQLPQIPKRGYCKVGGLYRLETLLSVYTDSDIRFLK